jgi:hypothetical protein
MRAELGDPNRIGADCDDCRLSRPACQDMSASSNASVDRDVVSSEGRRRTHKVVQQRDRLSTGLLFHEHDEAL